MWEIRWLVETDLQRSLMFVLMSVTYERLIDGAASPFGDLSGRNRAIALWYQIGRFLSSSVVLKMFVEHQPSGIRSQLDDLHTIQGTEEGACSATGISLTKIDWLKKSFEITLQLFSSQLKSAKKMWTSG